MEKSEKIKKVKRGFGYSNPPQKKVQSKSNAPLKPKLSPASAPPSIYARIRQEQQEELQRRRRKRVEDEIKLRATYKALADLDKLQRQIRQTFCAMNKKLSSMTTGHLFANYPSASSSASASANYDPFEFLDDDDEDDFDFDDDDDELFNEFDYRFAGIHPDRKVDRPPPEDDEYIFLSQDAKGKPTEKRMKPNGETPFKIVLSTVGFNPEDIRINSEENRMTIYMTKIQDFKYYANGKETKPKIFGIHCPTVDSVDKLNIKYPKNGSLVIEGPKKIQ